MRTILELYLRPVVFNRYPGPGGETRYDFHFTHDRPVMRGDSAATARDGVMLKGLTGMLPLSARGKVYRLTLEEMDDPAVIPESDR
jgi:hypothetical protein